MKKKSAIIIAIILMSIGFASVSTTLMINGNAKISEGIDDFDIYFSKVFIDNKDVYKSVVSQDKKSITFTTSELKTLGQTSMLTYEVTNNSSNYDANVSVTCVPKEGTTAKYTSIKNKFDGNASKVLAKNSLNGTLTITLNSLPIDEVVEEYLCKLDFNALERTEIGVSEKQASSPELIDNMVPVTINNDGEVRKADITKKWYNYEEKEWANAVILNDDYDYLRENGKINGATKENDGVLFDGVDDYVELGFENYDFKDALTLVTKFKVNSSNDHSQCIVGNWQGGGGGILINSSNKIVAELYLSSQQNYVKVESNENVEVGKEYVVIAKYDGKNLCLFINGALIGKSPLTGMLKASTMPITLGANPDPVANCDYANMLLKKVALFDRALSDDEITNYYKDDVMITNKADLLKYVNFEGTISNNEIILEENIQSYFVWIPRYRYKLFNVDNTNLTTVASAADVESKVQRIEIEFESKYDKVSNGTKNGEWLTHPAFKSFDTNGFWVGKFETGYKGATTSDEALSNTNDSNKIVIKPNVYSWRGLNVRNAYNASYNYNTTSNSHMIKNTEWGAVAYLSNSKYGVNGKININNNSSFKTGYSALPSTKRQTSSGETGDGKEYNSLYNTEIGYLASTTGNISGIYDIVGGAQEFVAAYIDGQTGTDIFPLYDSKYYDVYPKNAIDYFYKYRILGDATGEIGPFYQYNDFDGNSRTHSSWYNSISNRPSTIYSILFRGGPYSSESVASQFHFNVTSGHQASNTGFRIVLVP